MEDKEGNEEKNDIFKRDGADSRTTIPRWGRKEKREMKKYWKMGERGKYWVVIMGRKIS